MRPLRRYPRACPRAASLIGTGSGRDCPHVASHESAISRPPFSPGGGGGSRAAARGVDEPSVHWGGVVMVGGEPAWRHGWDQEVRLSGHRPVLMLDVDGPINVASWFAVVSDGVDVGFVSHRVGSHGRDDMEGIEQVTVRIPERMPVWLEALSQVFDLVWATFWEGAANVSLSPLLGLPRDLPVVRFPTEAIYAPFAREGSWKTPYVAQWMHEHAPGARWAWVDDEISARDVAWVETYAGEHGLGEGLLVGVPAWRGIDQAVVQTLMDFAHEA